MVTRTLPVVLFVAALSLAAGCGGSSSSKTSSNAFVAFINASTNSPDLDIYVEDRIEIGNLSFGEGTAYSRLENGVRNIKVVPSGTLQVLVAGDFEVLSGAAYSLLLVDNFSSIEPLFLRDDRRAPGANSTRFTFVHAGANLNPVDIYLTVPSIDINAVDPLVRGIPFKGATAFGELVSDFYRVRATTAGTKDILYDSGAVPFVAGTILSLILLDDPVGPVAVKMLTVDGGATPSSVEYPNAGSLLRIVAASPDAPTFKVQIDGQEIAGGFDFKEVSEYLRFDGGEERTISILNDQNSNLLAEIQSLLDPSTFFTLTVSNSTSNGLDPLLIIEDSQLPAAGFGRIQVVALAHTRVNGVDVYLVPFGTDINGRQPTAADVQYQDILGYYGRQIGDWEIIVTRPGQKSILATSGLLQLGDQKIHTALFIEPTPPGTNYALQVLNDN